MQAIKTKLLDWKGSPTDEEVVTGYIVVINTQPIQNLRNTMKLPFGHVSAGYQAYNSSSISATTFQTWQTGFNSEIESIKTTTQELSQGYNNANSITTTLNKLLTASIHSLFDSLAQYLRF